MKGKDKTKKQKASRKKKRVVKKASAEKYKNVVEQLRDEIAAHKYDKEMLMVSEERYRRLVETSPYSVVLADLDGKIIFCNQQTLKMHGYASMKEVLGMSCFDLFAPECRQQAQDSAKQAMANFGFRNVEYMLIRKDGSKFPAETSASLIVDKNGKPQGFIGILWDITERKKAERCLNIQYAITSAIIESGSIDDTLQKILRVICDENGWEIGEIWYLEEDKDVLGLSSQWHRPSLGIKEFKEFEDASRGIKFEKGKGLPGRVWLSGKAASIKDVLTDNNFVREAIAFNIGIHGAFAFPIRSANKFAGVFVFFSRKVEEIDDELLKLFDILGSRIGDFIECRRMDEVFRKTSQRLNSLLNASPLAIISLDSEKNITLWNKSAGRIFGWTESEVIGKPIPYISEDKRDEFLENLRRIYSGESLMGMELVRKRKDGTPVDIRLSVSPIYDKENDIKGCIAVIEDITEYKHMLKELEKIDKLESIGVLAGGVAHDFNNQLQAILGNIFLAKMYLSRKNLSPDDDIFKRLTDSEENCKQAKDLINMPITFAMGGEPLRETVSIPDLFKDAVNLLLGSTKVACEFKFSENLYPVRVDKMQMNQVIKVIIKNAVEAMSGEGIVEIAAETVDLKANDVLKDGRYIKVSITDHGVGIPDENLPKIFDPYFSTKERGVQKGMGLGLSICHSIIRRHDGLIAAESKVGAGTTFHIYLPAFK